MLGSLILVVSPSHAVDWYWVHDVGGIWDEQIGGASGWRTSSDEAGLPSNGDAALLTLPYSMSFCRPDGGCFTQPVLVFYRNAEPLELSLLDLEGYNLLFQSDSLGTPVSQLRLASAVEIVGGSAQEFSPPPSFPLNPDGPGIFPVGRHVQDAGENLVRETLVIGATQGVDRPGLPAIEGVYELRGIGRLAVGEFGFGIEKIGAAGDGRFLQEGGVHVVEGTLILGESLSGTGELVLSGGSLEAGSVVIVGSSGQGTVRHSAGSLDTPRLLLGQHPTGRGAYFLEADALLVVSNATSVNGDGDAGFVQLGGLHRTRNLSLDNEAESQEGYAYRLQGGELIVLDATTIGESRRTHFQQTAGVHRAGSLLLGASVGSYGTYELLGGRLEIGRSLTIAAAGGGSFQHSAGEVRLTPDDASFSTLTVGAGEMGYYFLEGGELHVAGRVYLGAGELGLLEQAGGTVRVVAPTAGARGYLFVGETDWGAYDLSGGTLQADGVIVGHLGGFGIVRQTRDDGASQATLNTLEIASRVAASSHTDYPGQDAVYDFAAGRLNVGQLRIGTGGVGLLQQSGGSLQVSERSVVGAGYHGSFRQTGGSHEVDGELALGETPDSVGRYELADATLDVRGVETIGVAGRGEFQHLARLGGYRHRVEGDLVLGAAAGAYGSYALDGSASQLTVVGTEMLGAAGDGVFVHEDGVHDIQGTFVLGGEAEAAGEYYLRDGELLVQPADGSGGLAQLGGRGTGLLEQTGGDCRIDMLTVGAEFGGSGRYALLDGQLDATYVRLGYAALAEGRFTQSGGVHRAFSIAVGGDGGGAPRSAYGEYALSDGELETSLLYVGYGGSGQFVQSGGTVTVAAQLDVVGDQPHESGHYALEGGRLDVLGNERVGGVWDTLRTDLYPRWATFAQTASDSIHRVDGQLDIGETGEYTLEQGTLITHRVEIHGGQANGVYSTGPSGRLVQTGGVHAAGTLVIREAVDYWGFGGSYHLEGGTLQIEDDLFVESGWSIRSRGSLHVHEGASLRLNDDTLHNEGLVEIVGDAVVIYGHVANRGMVEIRQAAANFEGLWEHEGTLLLDAAQATFGDLQLGPQASLLAASESAIVITSDMTGASRDGSAWHSENVELAFAGPGRHVCAIAGEDRGPTANGGADNFGWAALRIAAGVELDLIDGNPENSGTALYVGKLLWEAALAEPDVAEHFPLYGDAQLYYDPRLPENAYLGGRTYPFAGGAGAVRAQVPEPQALALAGCLAAISCLRKRHGLPAATLGQPTP